MWRSLGVAVGLVLAAGCAGSAPESNPPTRLTIQRWTGSADTVLVPSAATLSCDVNEEGTGFLERAARPACALIAGGVIGRIAADQRSARLCSQVYGGPQRAHIRGTVDRRRVDLTVTRTDGCGTADWHALEALLGDPERQGAPSARIVPTTAPTTTTLPVITYQVQRGESLTDISRRFGVSIRAIVDLNHLADPDQLAEGQSLLIPPAPPVKLGITPLAAPVGTTFTFELSGAHPSENVTFEVRSPDGTFTGVPHAASPDGVVTATYQTQSASPTGIYTVVAHGDQGTVTETMFRADPAGTAP